MRSGDENVSVPSLGARILRDPAAGGYRIDYIYQSDPDYPDEMSPLADPYLEIDEGDVIESVNGIATLDVPDIGALLRNQGGRQVLLGVRGGDDESRDVIVVPIGGGSGALAQCLVAKELRPGLEVIGVQAAGAPAVYESWKSRTLSAAGIDTAAEGLATGAAYHPAVRTLIDRLDDFVLVSEAEIRDAMLMLARTAHVIAEEAGAAATAAAVQLQERLAGKKVVIMVSGGNVPLDHLRRVLLEA